MSFFGGQRWQRKRARRARKSSAVAALEIRQANAAAANKLKN